VVHGIASMSDLKKIGRVGVKTLVYFEVVSTFALLIGLIVAEVVQPGHGFNIDPATLDPKSVAGYVTRAKEEGFVAHIMAIIPNTFVGALANGFSQLRDPDSMLYYDLPQYWDFWQVVESLDVPFYLHPRNPLPSQARIYEGHRWLLGPAWAFAQETAVHALRLMGSGLFDKYPRLAIVLGHMGEGLPFGMWRVDHCNGWVKGRHNYPAKKPIADYFHANFHVTVSGNFCTPALLNAMLELGSDRILFSTDWPFENVDQAAEWFDVAPISAADRLKIGRTNAVKLFKLDMT